MTSATPPHNVSNALAFLGSLTLTAIDATHALDRLAGRLNFLQVVRRFRPDLFRRHQRQVLSVEASFWELIAEFYAWLSTRFPVLYEGSEFETDCPDHYASYIEVAPQGEIWSEWDPEHIPLSICAALVLDGDIEPPRLLRGWERVMGVWNWETMQQRCAAERSPLRHAMQAAEMSQHTTENIWLDVTWEMMGGELPEMTEKEIEFLTEEWVAAKQILRGVNKLNDWLQADPERRLPRLQRLYLDCRCPLEPEPEPQRVRVGTSPTPLINLLPLDADSNDDFLELD